MAATPLSRTCPIRIISVHSLVPPASAKRLTPPAAAGARPLRPLLHEYWFDAPGVAEREAERLLEGW